MESFELTRVIAERQRAGKANLEFLRVAALSAGIYVLPAGGVDPQQPHAEDEVYYVLQGRGAVRVGEEEQPVAAATLVCVPAGVPHRFHSIIEELTLLVFFAPAEGS